MQQLKAKKPEAMSLVKGAILKRLKWLLDENQLAAAVAVGGWLDRFVSRHFEVCFAICPSRRRQRCVGDRANDVTAKVRFNRRRWLKIPVELHTLGSYQEVSNVLREAASWELYHFLAEDCEIIDGVAYLREELEDVFRHYLKLAREAAEMAEGRVSDGEETPRWIVEGRAGVDQTFERVGRGRGQLRK